MKLTFHGHIQTPRTAPALLSVRRDGAITLNSAGAGRLKQAKGDLVTLVSDEHGTWYLLFGPVASCTPFTWKRQSGGNGTSALCFFSGVRAAECLDSHQVPATQSRLYLEVAGGPERHDGHDLYRLTPTALKPTPKPLAPSKRPDEATLYRLNETVRTLGGMLLHKRPEQELTKALGLLQQYAEWLPTIAGGETLLTKLQAHFTTAA